MAIDLAPIKQALGSTPPYDEAYLTTLAAQLLAVMETYCQRVLEHRTGLLDTIVTPKYDAIYLRNYPVTGITSVTVTNEDGTTEVIDPEDYRVDYAKGIVTRISGSWVNSEKLDIVYDAGFDPFPDDLTLVISDVLASKYARRGVDPAQGPARKESIPGVISVEYGASGSSQYSMLTAYDPYLLQWVNTLDMYRSERAVSVAGYEL